MAGWIPVVKAAIPHIAQIVSVALPMFTARTENADREALTARQIEELQTAATQNAASVHELATQLQATLVGLESAAADLQAQVKRQRRLTVVALGLALVALALGVFILATRP